MQTVIADAGPLVAYLKRDDKDHDWAVGAFRSLSDPLVTCDAALSEAFFLLQQTPGGPERMLELLERGVVAPIFSLKAELVDVGRLLRKYNNIPMSLADACLVRMAETIPESIVLTLDSDFRVYRKNRRGEFLFFFPVKPRKSCLKSLLGNPILCSYAVLMARTILLVDDEEDALAVMAAALERAGYNVAQATNGQDAFRLWTESKPAIDLLVSDVRLQEEDDGFVLADKLLAARPGVPVIFVSGDRDCFASPAIQRFGDSPFIRKPFDVRKMVSSVQDALSKAYGSAN